jgi:hypothetical protein
MIRQAFVLCGDAKAFVGHWRHSFLNVLLSPFGCHRLKKKHVAPLGGFATAKARDYSAASTAAAIPAAVTDSLLPSCTTRSSEQQGAPVSSRQQSTTRFVRSPPGHEAKKFLYSFVASPEEAVASADAAVVPKSTPESTVSSRRELTQCGGLA